jgi:hypothetical protein
VSICVRGFNYFKNNNFEHLTANHGINFVDPVNKETHTNTKERAFESLKEYIPKSLTPLAYSRYVKCYLFKRDLLKILRCYSSILL